MTFDQALVIVMLSEVGPDFKLDAATLAGKIDTREQSRKVGYVNDPDDAGGETKFGISKRSYPHVDIKKLTWAVAKELYFNDYWLASGANTLKDNVSVVVLDAAVNHGCSKGVKLLQRAIGVPDDGKLGVVTRLKANGLPPSKVIAAFCDRREQLFRDIVAARPSQAKFLAGWLTRNNRLRSLK